MKILWLNHFLPYLSKGGALQRSHHLLRQVASRHEVHLVALNQPTLISQTGSSAAEAVGVLASNIPMVLNHHNVESQMMRRRADVEPNPLRRLYFSREAGKLARFEGERRRGMVTATSSLRDVSTGIQTGNAVRLMLTEIWPALVADRPERRLTIVRSNRPPELLTGPLRMPGSR